MDGRRETIYSAARLVEHDEVVAGTPQGVSILASWNPEYVWLPATSRATRTALIERGYRLDADTDRSYLAVRPDMPALRAGESVAGSWCFP
jgi:hypothetical protein